MNNVGNPEDFLPRMNPGKFTPEKNSKYLDIPSCLVFKALSLDGFTFKGWALSRDVAPKEFTRYVCMVFNENGLEFWIHVSKDLFKSMAEDISSGIAKKV